MTVRTFDDLVAEAVPADVTGWGFKRPAWGYARILADRLRQVESVLDIDTSGDEVLAQAPILPTRMVATEALPVNAQRASELLGPRGVQVIPTVNDAPDGSYDLVTARHPR